MKIRLRIFVSGNVQGVFYRASTKAKAEEFGIHGFVRNESNGDVYIEAEGESENVYRLTEWCKHGPSGALVKNITTEVADVAGFTKFEIKRW